MGVGVSLICEDCKNEVNYLTGIGMDELSLESLFNGKNKRDYNRIQKMVESLKSNKEKYEIMYSYEVHLCDVCGYIENKAYISIITKYWKYDYLYNCPKCKDKLRKIDIREEVDQGNIKCPNCESDNVHVPEFGILWD